MNCLTFMVHLEDHSKGFHFLIVYRKNNLQCIFRRYSISNKFKVVYDTEVHYKLHSTEYCVYNIYRSFTGTQNKPVTVLSMRNKCWKCIINSGTRF